MLNAIPAEMLHGKKKVLARKESIKLRSQGSTVGGGETAGSETSLKRFLGMLSLATETEHEDDVDDGDGDSESGGREGAGRIVPMS